MARIRSWIMGRDQPNNSEQRTSEARGFAKNVKKLLKDKPEQAELFVLYKLKKETERLAEGNEKEREKAHNRLGKAIFHDLNNYEITDEFTDKKGKKVNRRITQKDIPDLTVEHLLNILELVIQDKEERLR